jgi:type II secretory pathway pseudopilin PulG
MNLSFLLNLALPLIRGIVKNRTQKRKMRNLMLEIFQAIKTAYADDEAFHIISDVFSFKKPPDISNPR